MPKVKPPVVKSDPIRTEDTKRFNQIVAQRLGDDEGKFILAYMASRFPTPLWSPGQPMENSIYRDGQMSVIFKLSDAIERGKKGE